MGARAATRNQWQLTSMVAIDEYNSIYPLIHLLTVRKAKLLKTLDHTKIL